LAADERDFDEEVVFSTDVIGKNDGNRLPIIIDLDNTQYVTINNNFWIRFIKQTLVSKNYYNPKI
jgi:hypothetical protein